MIRAMPADPPSRTSRDRERLVEVLKEGFVSARALSQKTHIPEAKVLEHLRAIRGLEQAPAKCRRCHTSLDHEVPFAVPSRCSACGSDQLDPPKFRLV